MPDTSICRTEFTSSKDPHGSLIETTLEGLIERFSTFEIGEKDGRCFSPAIFEGNYRANKNVIAIAMAVFDFDQGDDPLAITQRLTDLGLICIVHNSYSHTVEHPKFRVIIPFAKPLILKHWRHWSEIIWPKLRAHFHFDRCDESCKDAARFYYMPRKAHADLPHESEAVASERTLFDWSELITPEEVASLPVAETVAKPLGEEDPERTVDLEALKKKLRKRKGIAARLANGHDLTPPPEERTEDDLPRNVAWTLATKELVIAADDWMGTRALLQICIPSHERMSKKGDETTLVDIEGMIERGRAKAPDWRCHEEAERNVFKALVPLAKAIEEDPEQKIVDLEWRKAIAMTKTGDTALSTHANALEVFKKHPLWKGRIRRNAITDYVEIDVKDHPAFPPTVESGNLNDIHATYINTWFQKEPNLKCLFTKDILHDSIDAIAHDNTYNPILDLARSIPWDGTKRIETMLIDLFGAKLEENGEDLTAYQHEVARVFFLGAVARLLQPGCKVDTTLVLEGGQGIGKSKGLTALGGLEYCHTSSLHPDGGKDARSPLSHYWFIVLEEASAFQKSSKEAWKGFLTQVADEYRAPYGRRDKQIKRECIFIATTNEPGEYLTDPTGERRFLPCPLSGSDIDTAKIESVRQQLLAEALARLEAGEKHYTTDPKLKEIIKRMQETRTSIDTLEAIIENWWQNLAQRPRSVRIITIIQALGETSNRSLQTRIGSTLRRLGWTLAPRRDKMQREYVPPADWFDRPRGALGNAAAIGPKKPPEARA